MKNLFPKINKSHFLMSSYILSAFIALLVYLTGGTGKVYANLMYLPIAIVASTNGKKHGVIHAVLSSLLIGHFMPLNVAANIPQQPINWILRLIIYATIAYVIGFFAEYYEQEYQNSIKKDKEIAELQMATIYSLVKLSESRDHNTGAHIERVAGFCELLATKLRQIPKYKDYITDEYIDYLAKASALHDIGKVGIPDCILLKQGMLSAEEYEEIKRHTTIGANTLLEVQKRYPDNKFLELGINIARYHHEKWDGSGYPEGLSGSDIPLSARIMALADVYDALRSERPYKKQYSHEESLAVIIQARGSYFDPEIVDVFIANESEFRNLFDRDHQRN